MLESGLKERGFFYGQENVVGLVILGIIVADLLDLVLYVLYVVSVVHIAPCRLRLPLTEQSHDFIHPVRHLLQPGYDILYFRWSTLLVRSKSRQ